MPTKHIDVLSVHLSFHCDRAFGTNFPLKLVSVYRYSAAHRYNVGNRYKLVHRYNSDHRHNVAHRYNLRDNLLVAHSPIAGRILQFGVY